MSDQNPYQPQPPAGYHDPYAQPPAGYHDPYAAPKVDPNAAPTNTLAIVALVLGLTVPIGGIVLGHIALSQIKRTGEAGRGMALAGLIIGYAYTALVVLAILAYILFFVVLFGVAGISHSSSGYTA